MSSCPRRRFHAGLALKHLDDVKEVDDAYGYVFSLMMTRLSVVVDWSVIFEGMTHPAFFIELNNFVPTGS